MTFASDRPEPQAPRRAPAPWGERAERADIVIALLLGLYVVYSLVLWPLVPALIGSHPLLLEIVGGSTLAEVTVGAHSRLGELPLWFAIALGVPGSMMFDWVFWWAGRRWGDRALHVFLGRDSSPRGMARREVRIAHLERMAGRFGPAAVVLAYYLPLPSLLFYVAAGLSGMRLRTFLVLDVLGTLLWVAPIVSLGYAIGKPAVEVIDRIDHYSTFLTIAVVVVVIGLQSRRRRVEGPAASSAPLRGRTYREEYVRLVGVAEHLVGMPGSPSMTALTDRIIAALRAEHEVLAGLVAGADSDRLTAPSGAEDWSVAQVLSHLGSGAEIGRAPIARAAGESVDIEENQTIWARWDGATAEDQATGFVGADARWLETVEALTPEQRATLVVDLGFLPEPVPLVTALGLRLNEVANHSWDVRVAFDPQAEVAEASAEALVDLYRGPAAFLLGWVAKERPAEETTVAVPSAGSALVLGETVELVDVAAAPSATLEAPAGAFVRLLNGRLKEPYLDGVAVTGTVTLDELRQVFPGF